MAQDALGRNLPTSSAVGPVKKDQRRVVGIFYITWHSDSNHKLKSPYAADVSAACWPAIRRPAWMPSIRSGPRASYHWGEPEAGYFLSKDEYVIRKDMSMLADAGVDVLVMDVTNAVRYWDEWEVLFAVMQKMKAEGNRVPQFCFWAFNGPVITVVQDLYDKIYKPGKHQDLWFHWDGKPLLLYNGNPSVDANGKGVAESESALRSRRQDRPQASALWRPRLHRGVLQGLHQGSEELLHAAHDVVGLPRMGRQTLCRHGRQLELRLGPGRQAGRGDDAG